MSEWTARLGALRLRAEDALARGEVLSERANATLETNLPALLENLRIYQAELELQNDELREAQEKARVSLRQYTALFEELPVAAVVIAASGVIEQHNREAIELLGEDAFGRPQSLLRLVDEGTAIRLVEALVAPSEHAVVLEHASVCLAHTTPVPVELRLVHLPHDTRTLVMLLDRRAERERELTREGDTVLFTVVEALHDASLVFESRLARALAAVQQMEGLYPGGGAWLRIDRGSAGGVFERHFGASLYRGGLETSGTVVQLIDHCPLREVAHGHYLVPITQAEQQLGVLVLDTLGAPPRNPARLAALSKVGDLLATAFLNERALELVREASAAAEEANRAKDSFIAMMSHELRTPLNGILGMAQMLLMSGNSEDEKAGSARTIVGSGQALLTLLNDILDLSRVEAGRLELELVGFEPAAMLEDVRALFAEQASARGLRLDVSWEGDLTQRYEADTHRVRQMVTNFVSNSLKFTSDGGVTITARELGRAGELAQVEFSVTDTGMGVPLEKQAGLFEPFVQVDASTAGRFGGSGLGLSIVKRLAHRMGGTVGLSSEPGRGSRFWFRLPLRVTSEAPPARPSPPKSFSPGEARHVLVVEDTATNRLVITALLKKLGCTVLIAENGEQAVTLIREGARPDVVLMDLHMPVLDGFGATAAIRAWEQERGDERVPIVALTADAFERDRQHCLAAGMNAFLTKPIVVEDLRRELARWRRAQSVT